MTAAEICIADARKAKRAIGAMFFSAFGGAWLILWAQRAFLERLFILVSIVVIALAIFALSYCRYIQNRSALVAEAGSPEKEKTDRIFHIVNVGQWVAMFVVGNVLANIGLSTWVIPAAIFIIGLHFLPLAHIFLNRSHYFTGGAMMMLAIGYPLLSPDGPVDPIGCFGAGLILWASSIWAVTANSSIKTSLSTSPTDPGCFFL